MSEFKLMKSGFGCLASSTFFHCFIWLNEIQVSFYLPAQYPDQKSGSLDLHCHDTASQSKQLSSLPSEKLLIVQVYESEAQKLGIDLKQCSHNVHDFSFKSLPGDYRRLLVRPKQLSWKLILYSDLQQDLAFTDLDAVLQRPRPNVQQLPPGINEFLLINVQFHVKWLSLGEGSLHLHYILEDRVVHHKADTEFICIVSRSRSWIATGDPQLPLSLSANHFSSSNNRNSISDWCSMQNSCNGIQFTEKCGLQKLDSLLYLQDVFLFQGKKFQKACIWAYSSPSRCQFRATPPCWSESYWRAQHPILSTRRWLRQMSQ